jgi:hypothetical protein
MPTFIISGSRGTDDPTMATLPFMAAKTAKEQGHDVVLWLWNEAVTLGAQRCGGSCDRRKLDPAERAACCRTSGRSADLGLRSLCGRQTSRHGGSGSRRIY